MKMHSQDCCIVGCPRKIGRKGARGMCSTHYSRWRHGREIEAPIKHRTGGWISSHGYHYVGGRAVHRVVIESHLGRELHYNEVIHHKDGDTLNNDLENLEIMDRGEHIRAHLKGKTNEQRRIEKELHGYCLAGRP